MGQPNQRFVLPLTAAITQRAVSLMATLALSHGVRIADALIAATAIEHRLTLLSGDVNPHGDDSISGRAAGIDNR